MTDYDSQLPPVAEKSLPARCKPNMVTYCPTMDLVALVTAAQGQGQGHAKGEELCVYRLNGQRVFGGSFGGDEYDSDEEGQDGKDGREVRGVRWKNNGMFLFLLSLGIVLC